jgi:hypothetical protein
MYQQQAELRIGAVQAILTPVLLLFVGLVRRRFDDRDVRAAV